MEDLKTAVKVFAAVASYASTDKTRHVLQYVYAPTANTLVATDGHALVRLTLDKPHGFKPADKGEAFSGMYEVKPTLAKLKAGIAPGACPAVADDLDFPAYERVIPKFRYSGEHESATLRAIDPALLARCLDAFAAVGKAFKRGMVPVRIQAVEDSHSPTRLDMACEGDFKMTAVVMPVRAEDADFKSCAA